jgi:hypothetical protein
VSAFNTIPAASAYSNEASATTAVGQIPPPQAAGGAGGGGGCSVAAKGRSAAGDAFVFLLPLLALAAMRRIHCRKK